MLPPSPVSGPISEDGFVFPLFELFSSHQIADLVIELVADEKEISPKPDNTVADDNQCACQ